MIAFEVHRNGEKLCTAGVSEGVLTAVLSWVGGKRHERESAQHGLPARRLDLYVGGLLAPGDQAGQHLKWRDDDLQPGDSVLIKVIEVDVVDAPVSREPQDPEISEKNERIMYERLHKKYGQQNG